MKYTFTVRTGIAIFGCLYLVTAIAFAAPLSTAFTYQGQLKDAGVPASDDYDMRFSLFDAANSGNLVAGPLVHDGTGGNPATVPVTNGLFTAALDFGDVFDGSALWLQVEVRPHGVGGYIALTPRQPLTAAPFAIYAMDGPGQAGFWSANGNSIYKTNSGSVGIGATDPQANLEVRSSSFPRLRIAKIHTGGFGVAAPAVLELKSNFTGTDRPFGAVNFLDGNDNVRGSIEYGANSAAPLSPFSLRLGTAGQTRLAVSENGNIGIGTSAPAQRLSVEGNGYASGSFGIGTAAPAVRLHVTGGSDTSLGGGGYLLLGNTNGLNISIDNNEIMARNNGAVSPLHLNANGGDVVCGGSLDIGYQVVTTGGATASCPAGKKPIGGGCHIVGDAEVTSSRPTATGWSCDAGDQVGFITLTTYAICVNVK